MNKSTKWKIENVMLLAKAFPNSEMAYDCEAFTWVFIRAFPLPENIRQEHTRLLIIMAVIAQPPGNVYVDKGLTDLDGNAVHFLFTPRQPQLKAAGFAEAHLGFRQWNPSYDVMKGDNLITVTNLIYDAFQHCK